MVLGEGAGTFVTGLERCFLYRWKNFMSTRHAGKPQLYFADGHVTSMLESDVHNGGAGPEATAPYEAANDAYDKYWLFKVPPYNP
jgi:prepilin-type processing-associated H-X9-DG protein